MDSHHIHEVEIKRLVGAHELFIYMNNTKSSESLGKKNANGK